LNNLIKNNHLIKKINGPVFSIITPFKKNEKIDYNLLFKNLKFYYQNGVRVFYLMFYNSRLNLLSERETLTLNIKISHYIKKNFKNTIFIGAIKMEGSAKEILSKLEKLSKSKMEAVSIVFGEKFYSEDQVYSHFKYLNDKSSLPILLHLQMMMSGFGIKPPFINYSLKLAQKICSLNNIVAIKDDAKIHDFTIKLISKVKSKVLVIRSGGGMSAFRKYYSKGCHSWLVGLELLDPTIAFDYFNALKNKDINYLIKIEKFIEEPFFKEMKKYGWHLFIKSCLENCRIMNRDERLPLKKLHIKDHKKISKFMENLRKSSKKYLNKNYFYKRNLI